MAEGGVIHNSTLMRFGEEHLKCSICQDLFRKPKTLTCLHSFCEECLCRYQQSCKRNIVCPLCRTETLSPKGGIRKLTTDFKLASMVDTVVQENKKKIPTCSRHAGKKCVIFCETCCDLLCLSCLVESDSHRKHEVGDVSTVVVVKRQFVKANKPKYQEHLEENVAALATVVALKDDLEVALQESRAEVEAKANEEIANVTAAKQRILDELNHIHTAREKLLSGYTEDLNSRNGTLQQMIHHFENAVQTYNDYEFLQRYSTLSWGFRFLTDHPNPNIDTNVSTLTFRPTTATGNVNLGSLWTVRPSEWELWAESCRPTSASCGGRNVTTLSDGTLLVADPWRRRIVKVNAGEFSVIFKAMKTRPRDISTTGDHLVVVDNTSFVKMFDLGKGGEDFEFPTVPSCEVGKTRVDLRSVAVKESGNIVVGDVKRLVMTEHLPSNGSLLRFTQLNTPPEFLALNSQSQALVSGEYSGKVDGLTNDHCDTSFTITPTIQLASQKSSTSKVPSCTGVCFGKCGGFYVAVHKKAFGTGHVHHYDATGRFVKCIAQGLHLPQGIKLVEDDTRMVVADYYTIKFYRIRE